MKPHSRKTLPKATNKATVRLCRTEKLGTKTTSFIYSETTSRVMVPLVLFRRFDGFGGSGFGVSCLSICQLFINTSNRAMLHLVSALFNVFEKSKNPLYTKSELWGLVLLQHGQKRFIFRYTLRAKTNRGPPNGYKVATSFTLALESRFGRHPITC